MKRFRVKYSYCGDQVTATKTIEASDSQDAINKFKEWNIHQHSPFDKIYSITEAKPRIGRDAVLRDLGLVKVRGALGGIYWE